MRILVIVERTATGFSAFSPDVPGCAATGPTREEVEVAIQDAMALHLDGLKAAGCEVPEPHAYATHVEVPA
jgi:predicted RNase H-like HicB family nuclease